MNIALIDACSNKRKILRDMIAAYAIKSDKSIDLLSFEDAEAEYLERYANQIHIALISLDETNGISKGQRLYAANPDTRIIYYSSSPVKLFPLLQTRPISYYVLTSGADTFERCLASVIAELEGSVNMFYHENRKIVFLCPYRDILYAYSDLKHVHLVHCDGHEDVLYSRLTDLTPKLKGFWRIHQSYIVNPRYVSGLDRETKEMILITGIRLPISANRFKEVMELIKYTVMNEVSAKMPTNE